jgi:transposase-like protein
MMSKQSKTAATDRPELGSTERSPVERSETGRSGGNPNSGPRAEGDAAQSNETLERPRRRSFTAEYKQRILIEVDAAAGVPGGIGAVLRREGLYSSHLGKWRAERASGGLAGLSPKRRGPAPHGNKAERKRMAQLERENERLRHRLKQAETIIEFQKKLHELLGTPLGSPPELEENSR